MDGLSSAVRVSCLQCLSDLAIHEHVRVQRRELRNGQHVRDVQRLQPLLVLGALPAPQPHAVDDGVGQLVAVLEAQRGVEGLQRRQRRQHGRHVVPVSEAVVQLLIARGLRLQAAAVREVRRVADDCREADAALTGCLHRLQCRSRASALSSLPIAVHFQPLVSTQLSCGELTLLSLRLPPPPCDAARLLTAC